MKLLWLVLLLQSLVIQRGHNVVDGMWFYCRDLIIFLCQCTIYIHNNIHNSRITNSHS